MNSIPQNISGIYSIKCIPTGKLYIGSSCDLRNRWKRHRTELRAGTHHSILLQRAWNKYGEDAFIVEVLELVMFTEHLIEREQYYLDTLRTYNSARGFNISKCASAPTLGQKLSEETRRRMSAARIGKKPSEKTRQRLSEAKRRTPQSQLTTPEARAKCIAAQKGRKHTDEARQKMAESARQQRQYRQYPPRHIVTTPDGKELLVHLRTFCKEQGLSYQCMSNTMSGSQKFHKGYKARRITS